VWRQKVTAYSLRHSFQDASVYLAHQLAGRELDDGSAADYGVGADIKVVAK
jgi:hypothetical protein